MKSRGRRLPLRERLRFALLAALTTLLASVAAAACGSPRQAPATDAPAEAAPAETAPAAGPDGVSAETSGYVRADAEFMRDMLVHHAQALEMTVLAPERSASDDLRLLARRIEQTQEFEIGLMRDWLEKRGEPPPEPDETLGPHGGHGAQHAGMAGMASPEQMADLAASEGAAFDRMFLELMIRHHEGALVMVDDLKDHEGAGLEPELFVLLSHIDADQRAEIARMRRFLDSLDSAGDQG